VKLISGMTVGMLVFFVLASVAVYFFCVNYQKKSSSESDKKRAFQLLPFLSTFLFAKKEIISTSN